MRLTIRCDRSHPGRFRLEEVHALCAGDLYNPLVVEGAEGADPLTLHLLLLPSAGSPESSALARAEGFGRERGHAGCMRSVLSLRTAELRDLWDSATESSESSDGAPSGLDVVRSAHLLVRDSAGLTLASGPVPLVLRPLSDWDYAAADPPRDGFTPTVSVEEVSGGVRVTAANRYGSESAVVRDGVDGGTPSVAVTKDRRTGVVAVSAYGPDGTLASRETIGPFPDPDFGPVERRLDALEGADAGKSARGIAAEEVAKIVANADSGLDTLKEIADFLSDDQTAGTVAKRLSDLESGKVDVVSGKGLSTNDYTDAEKTKLAGIAAGAEVNVQSDWNQTNSSADDYIKNKPDVAGIAATAAASKRGKLDLAVYQDAVGWAMADGAGDAYGMFVPISGSTTRWILAEDEQSGAQWGLQYNAPAGSWSLAGEAVSPLSVSAPADAATLSFTHSSSGSTYTLTRVSPAPTADTLVKTSDIDAALSPTSENPVQNKAVKAALDGSTTLNPIYGGNGQKYSEWTFSDVASGIILSQPTWYEGGAGSGWDVDYSGLDSGTVLVDAPFDAVSLSYDQIIDGVQIAFTATRAVNMVVGYMLGDQSTKPLQPKGNYATKVSSATNGNFAALDANGNLVDSGRKHSDYLTAHQDITSKLDVYPFEGADVADGVLTVMPFTSAQYAAQSGDDFVVDVGALPQGVAAGTKVRDCILAIDATANTPSVTFGQSGGANTFAPANGDNDNMACEAGAENVYYISEYAPNAFLVARQVIGGSGS